MAIVMGLLAALSWGWGDFLAGSAGRAIGVRRTLFFSQALAFLVATLLLAALPAAWAEVRAATSIGWLWGILSGAANFAAVVSLTIGLTRGKAALVAPVTATYGAITALLSLASGEAVSLWALAGIVLCVLGVPLTAFPGKTAQDGSRASSAVAFRCALIAAGCFGVGFWIQGRYAVPALGTVPTLWVFQAIDIGCILIFFCVSVRPGQFALPPGAAWPATFGTGLMSVCGFGAVALGALSGEVAVTAVLSTLAGSVTAGLGVLLRGERLSRIQWCGIATVLVGVALLRVGG
jgi:drug/metabolite transporter (DMT)-like permease